MLSGGSADRKHTDHLASVSFLRSARKACAQSRCIPFVRKAPAFLTVSRRSRGSPCLFVFSLVSLTGILLGGEVLLGNLNLGRAHEPAGIAHDIGILIDQEDIVQLDAGVRIGVVRAVPLRVRGEDLVCLRDIVDIGKLALAVDDVQSVLGKTSGNGVAIGVCPGAEAACATLFLRILSKSPASSVRSRPSAPG